MVLDDRWHLKAIGASAAWALGLKGRGVRIGVVDGGVDPEHPELVTAAAEGRIECRRFAPGPAPLPEHGSAVASLLVGKNQGVAKQACLVMADIYTRGRHARAVSARPQDVRAGLRWLLDEGRVDLVLMTLERRGQDDWIRDLVQQANDSGVLVVASIGNGGHVGETGSPGNYPETLGVGSLTMSGQIGPESAAGVLSWGGATHRKPDVLAPGSGVRVALCPRRYGWERGTSFAAPLVAASAALLLQADRGLGPRGLRRRIGVGHLDLRKSLRLSPTTCGEAAWR